MRPTLLAMTLTALLAGRAIKGPKRVDIFMGTGEDAQRKANSVSAFGEMYYLLLKQ